MIFEELCVSRNIADKMAKLGWPQEESLFVWGKNTKLTVNKDKWFLTEHRNHCLIWFAAPTAPEIWEMLPNATVLIRVGSNRCVVGSTYPDPHIENDTVSLANAAGKYYCWWKEKGEEK